MTNLYKVPSDKQIAEYKKTIEQVFESEQMRAITLLFLINPVFLSERAQTLASLGVKKLIDEGMELHTTVEAT